MADRRIDLQAGASEDYLQALDWYLDRSTRVAERFQDEFSQILERIISNPEIPEPDADGIR